MVDAIGSRAVSPSDRVASVGRVVTSTTATAPVTAAVPATETNVGALAKDAAASAPVQADRVAQIKKAVADGTFPILPGKIADRLIALKFDWLSHD